MSSSVSRISGAKRALRIVAEAPRMWAWRRRRGGRGECGQRVAQGPGRGGAGWAAGGGAVGMRSAARREGKGAGGGGDAGDDGGVDEDDDAAIEQFADVDAPARVGAAGPRGICRRRGPTRTVLSRATTRAYRQLSTSSSARGGRRQTGWTCWAARLKRRLKSARNAGKNALAAARVAMRCNRSSLTSRSCKVPQRRSMRPLA